MATATARALTGLMHDLTDEELLAHTESSNRTALKEFLAERIASGLPTTMTIGGRAYDILSFLRGDEKSVSGATMVERAKEDGAHNGKEEREHLLKHQDEIPAILRGKVVFVFTDDRPPGNPECVCCVCWRGGRWVGDWDWQGLVWSGDCRVLRRK